MGIIISLLLGCLAGFCAGKLMKGGGYGIIMNCVLGLFGGALGGWLFSLLGISWGGLLGQLGTAIIGAVAILRSRPMVAGKWIGGFIGWMAGGPLGALAGYLVGSLFDSMLDGVNTPDNSGTWGSGSQRDQGWQQRSYQDYSQMYQQAYRQRQQQGNRNSFLFSLLVLSSYIIKADGKAMHSEMELVRQMLRQNFGANAVNQGNEILNKLFDEQKREGWTQFKSTVRDCCSQINRQMDYSQRLQLLNYLVMVAKADGNVPQSEITALKECAQWMGLRSSEVDSMLHLEGNTLEDAYKVLGVSPDASDDEVKKAYRKLALEHHPDKVAALGEDVRKAAEKNEKAGDCCTRGFRGQGFAACLLRALFISHCRVVGAA